MSETDLAARLLDIQVAWVIDQLTGARLPELVERDIDELMAIGELITVAEAADADTAKRLIRTAVEKVPASSAGSTAAAVVAEVVHRGPGTPFTLAEVIDRDNVERIAAEVFGAVGLIEKVLDDLTRSPLAAGSASRFLNHLVAEVLSANKAVAEKIPGMGGLMSMGAGVTNRVKGVADKQIDAVIGGTATKGGQFAARRLNKIIVQTLKDPATHQAVLEVFDLYADVPIQPIGRVAAPEDLQRIVDLVQDIVIAGAPSAPVLALLDALVDGFFATYGSHSVADLVTDLDLTRDDLVAHGTDIAVQVLSAAHESGALERLVRERLGPFWALPEVSSLLTGA